MVNAHCNPVITVSQDLYDAILLADRVMVVAAGRPSLSRVAGGGLPDFFSVRESVLTTGTGVPARSQAAILRLMVGG